MKKIALFIFILLLSAGTGLSQADVELEATVNKTTISIDGYLKLRFTLKNARTRIEVPEMENFRIVQGPQVGTNTIIVNGEATREYSQTYLVKPMKAGTHRIPPAQASVNGKVYKSNPITIKVLEASATEQPNSNSDFFIAAIPNKRKAYKGEPITVAVKLYSRFRSMQMTELNFPELEGFWSEELTPENNGWQRENVNGREFLTMDIKHFILFPQKTGELTFGGVELSANVSTSIFGGGKRYDIRSTPIKFKVLDLPQPPADAKMIGTFDQLEISSEISRTSAGVNQSIELSLNFIGSGNLNLLNQPELNFPKSFELFDPVTDQNINVGRSGVTGQKAFTFMMIPRKKGTFKIPEQKLVYFDSQADEYRTHTIGPYEITIHETAEGTGGMTYNSKDQVNVIGQNIREIKTESKLTNSSQQFFGSTLFVGLLSLPVVILILLFFYGQKLKAEDKDVKGTKLKKAGREALRQFSKIEKQLSSLSDNDFYSRLSSTIYSYISVKYGIEMAELNKSHISEAMEAKHSKGEIDKTIEILETCEMAQFAPSSSSDKLSLLNDSKALIKTLEASER
ncbi:BatD family protein [Halocola ammonii]